MNSYSLINDTTRDEHVGCDAVMRTIRDAAARFGYTEAASQSVGAPIRGLDYDRLLNNSELIVINGEGTLHDDGTACKSIAHFAAVAKRTGRRVALINSSYSNNSAVTSELFSRCDVLAFRESNAARSFRAHCPDVDVLVVGDLSLQSFPQASTVRHGAEIVVTDSVLPDATRTLLEIGCAFGARYACVKDFDLRSKKNLPLRAGLHAVARDAARLQSGARLLRDVWTRSRQDFNTAMEQAGLVITGRFHAVMYCLKNEVPFLYLPSNTSKIDHVLADAGLDIARRKIGDPKELTSSIRRKDELIPLGSFSQKELLSLRQYLQRQSKDAEALLAKTFGSWSRPAA